MSEHKIIMDHENKGVKGRPLSTKDVADFFQKSVDWVHHSYPKWIVEYGIKPFRSNGNPKGHPMWHRSDIEKLTKLWTVDACLEKKVVR